MQTEPYDDPETLQAAYRALLLGGMDWLPHLPEADRWHAVAEISATDDEGRKLTATQWQHTADIYANPELLNRLQSDSDGDFGEVPRPE